MEGGFSFCGTDIADLNLTYAPELENTYVYRPATWTPHEENIEGHDGGYFYGETLEPKEFNLRCIFEEEYIRNGIMTEIHRVFRRGRTGKLVFKHRPWIYYNATVVDVDDRNITNYLNGIITIVLRAYYPYGRSEKTYIDDSSILHLWNFRDDMLKNSAFFLSNNLNPEKNYVISTSYETEGPYLLYNAGTERAKVSFEIAGTASGLIIHNATTNQKCKFVALDALSSGEYLIYDGINSKTIISNGSSARYGFLHHDYGSIELAPACPIVRDVYVTYAQNSNIVYGELENDRDLPNDITGKYIYINGWHKITSKSGARQFTINANMESNGTAVTNIALMNEIYITPDVSMNLTRMNFIYQATFS